MSEVQVLSREEEFIAGQASVNLELVNSEFSPEFVQEREVEDAATAIRSLAAILAAETKEKFLSTKPDVTNQLKPSSTTSKDSSDTVGLYLNEVGSRRLLEGAPEERELSILVQAGLAAKRRMDEVAKSGERIHFTERRKLKQDIQDGQEARDKFIESNLRLVVRIAKKYPVPRTMEFIDLIQEGNLGMAHAVDMFDWRKGFKFSTYATWWVRQAIGRVLSQKGSLICLPGDIGQRLRTAQAFAFKEGKELDADNAELERDYSPS